MTANLHAIWLDDLAPGEGATTPIWDALYAEQDAETQRVVFNACADEHTEPVALPTSLIEAPPLVDPIVLEGIINRFGIASHVQPVAPTPITSTPKRKKPTPRKPAAKKATPRKKPAAKSPLAAQEAKLRTVRGRLADEFKTLGGEGGEVNELGVAFACLLGLLLAPVLIAVFG